MCLAIQKKVASSADSFVAKLQNGLDKIDAEITLSKDKHAPTLNYFSDAFEMSETHNKNVRAEKKQRASP